MVRSGRRWHAPAFYAAYTAILLTLPVVRVLHAESCAALALVAFFVSGLDALSHLEQESWQRLLLRHLSLLAIPVALFQVARLWSSQCGMSEGLIFLALFPGITVILGVSAARFVRALGWHRPKLLLVAIGLAVIIFPTLYDIGLHPQFYVYNHVFGGILGPIYDEELTLRSGLFVFRGLTVLWALLLLLAAATLESGSWRRRWIQLGTVSAAILVIYAFPGRTGINTTHGQLYRALGGNRATAHFEIVYDQNSLEPHEVQRLADEHEFRYAQIARRLGEELPVPIVSFVYPDPESRARLTGARYTSVAPLWLRRPQLHITEQSIEHSLAHEIVHVVSEEIGLPGISAAPLPGLVEGLAVALEPPIGVPGASDQVAAALAVMDTTDYYSETSLSEAVASRLRPLGFWLGRGAVSYTTMGSFVEFLIDTYGILAVKSVYRTGDFEGVCGKPLFEVTADWERMLRRRPVSNDLSAHVARRFSRPALAEQACPHHVPKHIRRVRNARRTLARGDTTSAISQLRDVMVQHPEALDAQILWASLKLGVGDASEVADSLHDVDLSDPVSGEVFGFLLGDALALSGNLEEARVTYARVDSNLSPYRRATRALIELRTMLAAHPEIIETLRSTEKPEERLRFIGAAPGEAAALVRGLLHLSAGQYPQAYTELGGIQGDRLPEVLSRRMLYWKANSAMLAGQYDNAAHHAREALYATLGDKDDTERLRLADFMVRIVWHRDRGVHNL
jgi:hypothetical protein